jgi:hypothetical protein
METSYDLGTKGAKMFSLVAFKDAKKEIIATRIDSILD